MAIDDRHPEYTAKTGEWIQMADTYSGDERRIAQIHAKPALAGEDVRHDDVKPLPVPAQADGRNHQTRLAAAAVFHVGIVVEDFAGVGLVGVAGLDRVRSGQAEPRPGRR